MKNNKAVYGRKHIALNKKQQEILFAKKLLVMQKIGRDIKNNELVTLAIKKLCVEGTTKEELDRL